MVGMGATRLNMAVVGMQGMVVTHNSSMVGMEGIHHRGMVATHNSNTVGMAHSRATHSRVTHSRVDTNNLQPRVPHQPLQLQQRPQGGVGSGNNILTPRTALTTTTPRLSRRSGRSPLECRKQVHGGGKEGEHVCI